MLGSLVTSSSNAAPTSVERTVKFHDGTVVPALGQGSWHLAQGRHPAAEEEEALRTGLALGMTLIDTAEVYSNGRSEELIGRAIAGQRDHAFLVSKVLPSHVTGDGMARACAASLARLGTDHLDLYLLHWRNGITDLSGVVTAFESLREAGKIRAWGVSLTSPFATWKICSVSHKAIAARRTRSLTTSPPVALNMTYCHGASSTVCR